MSSAVRRCGGATVIGIVGGTLLLIEPIFAIVMPIVAAAYWLGSRTSADRQHPRGSQADGILRRTLQVAAMAFAAIMVVAPWVWRNYRVHGEFVFIKSTFGYAFWQGNNPMSWGTDKVPKATLARRASEGGSVIAAARDSSPSLARRASMEDGAQIESGPLSLADQHRAMWEARHETLYIDDVLLKPTRYAEFAGLSEPQRCRLLHRRAWQFIGENPSDYVRLCGQRLRYFVLFDETNPKAASAVYRITTICWLALTVVGLGITRKHWPALWPLYAIAAAVTLFHTLTIVSARFRLPIEPLTFVWAAAALRGAANWSLHPRSFNRSPTASARGAQALGDA
jgi:hypothetical protein